MNLPELQRILARIVTEPDLRERFLDDPEGSPTPRDGTPIWPAALATIPAHQLRHYGDAW